MTKIEISTNSRFSWRRTALGLVVQVVPISFGILTGSAAMQWAGFVFTMLFMVAVVTVMVKQNTGLTVAEARKRLDEIEREQAK